MTTEEPRKASDILISLETTVNQMFAVIRNQDLVIKVLTNKLNSFIDTINSMIEDQNESNQNSAEPQIPQIQPIIAGNSLPVETTPQGFRRTSRPETYDRNGPSTQFTPPQPPVTAPNPPAQPEVQFPEYIEAKKPIPAKKVKVEQPAPKPQPAKISNTGSKIPVSQRIVNDSGKAVFIADVEIINSDNELVHKTRTNGMGKWEASLTPGAYKVKITKQESLSKSAINITQDVIVTGATSTQSLPVLIAK